MTKTVANQSAQTVTVVPKDCCKPKASSVDVASKSKLSPELVAIDKWAFETAKLVLQHPERAAEFKKEAEEKEKLLEKISAPFEEKKPIYQDLNYLKKPRANFCKSDDGR